MSYTNFNMRLDNHLRDTAYPVLEQYGLTASQAVRMFFNQIAKTGKIPLSFDWGSVDNDNDVVFDIDEMKQILGETDENGRVINAVAVPKGLASDFEAFDLWMKNRASKTV